MNRSEATSDGMGSTMSRWLAHGAGALALAALLLAADHIYGAFNTSYKTAFNGEAYAFVVVFGFFLLAVRSARVYWGMLALLGLLELAQFIYFAYFGSLIPPHIVGMLFAEWDEVRDSLLAVLPYLAAPLLIVGGCVGAAGAIRPLLGPRRITLPFAVVVPLTMLAIGPVAAFTHAWKVQSFYPDPRAYSLKNTWQAVSWQIGGELPARLGLRERPSVAEYLPYEAVSLGVPAPLNVVVVMGESLTSAHMGLFGYERETTPFLDELKSDPAFVYRSGLSAGIATKVTLPLFFNIQREPDNVRHMAAYETNLFRLAREHGFATHFYSVQTSNLTTYSGAEFADHYVTQDDIADLYAERRDEALLTFLEKADLTRPSLVVLHMRNSHSPYDRNYPAAFARYPTQGQDRHNYTVNSYDNSVLYTDHFLSRVVETLKARSPLPTVLMVTSDHGEMMGERGKYGHTQLEPEVARVPFLFLAMNGAPGLDLAQAMREPTHYEMGLLLARLLGYEIVNPNAVPGVFFINGMHLDGSGGRVKLLRPEDGGPVEFIRE